MFRTECRDLIQISRGGQADTDHVRAQPEELRPNVFVTARPVLESLRQPFGGALGPAPSGGKPVNDEGDPHPRILW